MLEELYLVRHATPDYGLPIPYNQPPGPPLTEHGQREAAETAAWLREHGIEHIYSSPFVRASQTADTIAERLELDVSYVESIREGGPGETLDQVQARVAGFLAEVSSGNQRCIAIVSHGACIRGALLHTTHGRIDLSRHVYERGNCSPAAGVWYGRIVDRAWHWELVFRPGQPAALAPAPAAPAPINEAAPPIGEGVEWV